MLANPAGESRIKELRLVLAGPRWSTCSVMFPPPGRATVQTSSGLYKPSETSCVTCSCVYTQGLLAVQPCNIQLYIIFLY